MTGEKKKKNLWNLKKDEINRTEKDSIFFFFFWSGKNHKNEKILKNRERE